MGFEKVKGMMDANGKLRYFRIFDDLLPTVGDDHFYAYLAARACSYMTYLMVQCNWKPRYYKPDEGLIILTDHIARFYGCQLARSNDGFPSIDDSWSTRDPLEAIGPLKECMPRDAFRDMYRCMHLNDDFDENRRMNGQMCTLIKSTHRRQQHGIVKKLVMLRTQYARGGRSTSILECG
jgi:hypothetical protein